MSENRKIKLSLSRETLRNLTSEQLTHVEGAARIPPETSKQVLCTVGSLRGDCAKWTKEEGDCM